MDKPQFNLVQDWLSKAYCSESSCPKISYELYEQLQRLLGTVTRQAELIDKLESTLFKKEDTEQRLCKELQDAYDKLTALEVSSKRDNNKELNQFANNIRDEIEAAIVSNHKAMMERINRGQSEGTFVDYCKGKVHALSGIDGYIVELLDKNDDNQNKKTWRESLSAGSPSMAEGYPCPPGTKVLLINKDTKEFKVTTFDPDRITTDWSFALKATEIISEATSNYQLHNLLCMMGWFKD